MGEFWPKFLVSWDTVQNDPVEVLVIHPLFEEVRLHGQCFYKTNEQRIQSRFLKYLQRSQGGKVSSFHSPAYSCCSTLTPVPDIEHCLRKVDPEGIKQDISTFFGGILPCRPFTICPSMNLVPKKPALLIRRTEWTGRQMKFIREGRP